jgi:hypothetical protein
MVKVHLPIPANRRMLHRNKMSHVVALSRVQA